MRLEILAFSRKKAFFEIEVLSLMDSNLYIIVTLGFSMVRKKSKLENLDRAYAFLDNGKLYESVEVVKNIFDDVEKKDVLIFYDRFSKSCDREIHELEIEIEELSKVPSFGNELADSCSIFAKEDLAKIRAARKSFEDLLKGGEL